MKIGNLDIDEKALAQLCQENMITALQVFGSALRSDFSDDSDVDVLVTYQDGFKPTLAQLDGLTRQLEAIFGRKVDLVEPGLLKWVIRDRVLQEAKLVYAA
jgi:predicted nucleotidyltransferase